MTNVLILTIMICAPGIAQAACNFDLAIASEKYIVELENEELFQFQGEACKVLSQVYYSCSKTEQDKLNNILDMAGVMGNICQPHLPPRSWMTTNLRSNANQAVLADPVEVGSYLANPQDSTRIWNKITQIEAISACKKKGSRLPTIRELLVDAKLPVISVAEYDEMPWNGVKGTYKLIEAVNPNGRIDRFYYSSFWHRQDGGTSNWSSSVPLQNKSKAFLYEGVLGRAITAPKNSYTVENDWVHTIGLIDRTYDSAARCMK